jgi:hypothetical protein
VKYQARLQVSVPSILYARLRRTVKQKKFDLFSAWAGIEDWFRWFSFITTVEALILWSFGAVEEAGTHYYRYSCIQWPKFGFRLCSVQARYGALLLGLKYNSKVSFAALKRLSTDAMANSRQTDG